MASPPANDRIREIAMGNTKKTFTDRWIHRVNRLCRWQTELDGVVVFGAPVVVYTTGIVQCLRASCQLPELLYGRHLAATVILLLLQAFNEPLATRGSNEPYFNHDNNPLLRISVFISVETFHVYYGMRVGASIFLDRPETFGVLPKAMVAALVLAAVGCVLVGLISLCAVLSLYRPSIRLRSDNAVQLVDLDVEDEDDPLSHAFRMQASGNASEAEEDQPVHTFRPLSHPDPSTGSPNVEDSRATVSSNFRQREPHIRIPWQTQLRNSRTDTSFWAPWSIAVATTMATIIAFNPILDQFFFERQDWKLHRVQRAIIFIVELYSMFVGILVLITLKWPSLGLVFGAFCNTCLVMVIWMWMAYAALTWFDTRVRYLWIPALLSIGANGGLLRVIVHIEWQPDCDSLLRLIKRVRTSHLPLDEGEDEDEDEDAELDRATTEADMVDNEVVIGQPGSSRSQV